MARTRTSGNAPAKAQRATVTKTRKAKTPAPVPVAPEHAEFAAVWNALSKERRRQVTALVRIGRPQETREDAELAVSYALYQRSRAWFRYFWPALVVLGLIGLLAAANVHPIAVGVVLGLAGGAVIMHRNCKRVEKINAPILDGATAPSSD